VKRLAPARTDARKALAAARLCASIAALLTAACAPRYQHLVERDLASTDSLTCPGYLVWTREPVRDVFVVINGSGTLSNAFIHPSFEGVMSTHPVAYSTYDKPGIRAPFDDPAPASRNDALRNDSNTPVEPVRALEAWNASQGRLAMEFHYYDGGHAGSEAARAEMARLYEAIVSQ
jgi:hypothetical protein